VKTEQMKQKYGSVAFMHSPRSEKFYGRPHFSSSVDTVGGSGEFRRQSLTKLRGEEYSSGHDVSSGGDSSRFEISGHSFSRSSG